MKIRRQNPSMNNGDFTLICTLKEIDTFGDQIVHYRLSQQFQMGSYVAQCMFLKNGRVAFTLMVYKGELKRKKAVNGGSYYEGKLTKTSKLPARPREIWHPPLTPVYTEQVIHNLRERKIFMTVRLWPQEDESFKLYGYVAGATLIYDALMKDPPEH